MEHIKQSCETILKSYQTLFEQFQTISADNERLKKENCILIDNEKDLMSVSSIVSTKNENASLLKKIAVLEKSNSALRQNITDLQKIIKSHNSIEPNNVEMVQNNLTSTDRLEQEQEELYSVTFKKVSYYLDTSNRLFSIGSDGEKLERIGKRIFDEKKGKHKYVLD